MGASFVATLTYYILIDLTVLRRALLRFEILASVGIDCLDDLWLVDIHWFRRLLISRRSGELLLEWSPLLRVLATRVHSGLSSGWEEFLLFSATDAWSGILIFSLLLTHFWLTLFAWISHSSLRLRECLHFRCLEVQIHKVVSLGRLFRFFMMTL